MFQFELVRFDELTPEVNAAQLRGVGATDSLVAAAKAWSDLAGELRAAAGNIHLVLGTLPWLWWSLAAAQMIKAGTRYLVWLRHTIGGVDVTAAQIERIAVAYEAARAAMVSTQKCTDLREDIDDLIARNQSGHYSSVIAANEAIYNEYWERNAKVMQDYAKEVSTALSLMAPFAQAPEITYETKTCLVQ